MSVRRWRQESTPRSARNSRALRELRERSPHIPMVIDGIGLPSHACQAMEWGFDGVFSICRCCVDCNLCVGKFHMSGYGGASRISVFASTFGQRHFTCLGGTAMNLADVSDIEIRETDMRFASEVSSSMNMKLYLREQVRPKADFAGIVGQSPALREVLQQVEMVAASDSTVLLLGETGTGKELIARAIHNCSRRKNRTFVKLNCAAIPSGLLESELFGHERGAFTGAITQKIGRLELADQGSLFLDEIGDIPLELQPKLLRVLQEREFERLGSTQTKQVDVRVVAATHRDSGRNDLGQAVSP